MEQQWLFPKREIMQTDPATHVLAVILAKVEEYLNIVKCYHNREEYVDIAPDALLGEFVRFLLITHDLIV